MTCARPVTVSRPVTIGTHSATQPYGRRRIGTPTGSRRECCHVHPSDELLTRTAVTAQVRRPHQLAPEQPNGENPDRRVVRNTRASTHRTMYSSCHVTHPESTALNYRKSGTKRPRATRHNGGWARDRDQKRPTDVGTMWDRFQSAELVYKASRWTESVHFEQLYTGTALGERDTQMTDPYRSTPNRTEIRPLIPAVRNSDITLCELRQPQSTNSYSEGLPARADQCR